MRGGTLLRDRHAMRRAAAARAAVHVPVMHVHRMHGRLRCMQAYAGAAALPQQTPLLLLR